MDETADSRVRKYACFGLTREHTTKLGAMIDLLQPRLSCRWHHSTQADAHIVFCPDTFAETVRSRLHGAQRAVTVWHDQEPVRSTRLQIEWPFRLAPVLQLLSEFERDAMLNDLSEPVAASMAMQSAHDDLLAVLKVWLELRAPSHWYQTAARSGARLWIHSGTLQCAVSPPQALNLPEHWSHWSTPLPVDADLTPSGSTTSLYQLVWGLIDDPSLTLPDWIYRDGLQIRLTAWPDLGEVMAPHWQIKLASLLSVGFSQIDELAQRTHRSAHDIAAFATICDVFGLVEQQLISTANNAHVPQRTKPVESVATTPPTVSFMGLIRTIRDRLYGSAR